MDRSLEIRPRDHSIDILKCFAALLIIWSHMDKPLGNYSFLATGGCFGDALFFFCSGYTLFLSSKKQTFFNWYKNRVQRIYPTVLAWALVLCVCFDSHRNIIEVLTSGGGWFVSYIMIFYVLFYPIKKYATNHLLLVLVISFVIIGISYFLIDYTTEKQEHTWLYSSFFTSMLLGGVIGYKKKKQTKLPFESYNKMTLFVLLCACVISYYGFSFLVEKYDYFRWLESVITIPICSFAYILYLLCNTQLLLHLYKNKYGNAFIMTVGGLCLELYLVQVKFLTDKYNDLMPLNIVVILVVCLVAAYLLRCVSRIILQTFKDNDYNWKSVFELY